MVADLIHQLAFLPDWAACLLAFAGAIIVAYGVHAIGLMMLRPIARPFEFWRNLVERIRRPTRLALTLLLCGQTAAIAPMTTAQTVFVQEALLFLFIILMGWTVFIGLDVASAFYMRRFRLDAEDNLTARKHITQVRILRRAFSVLVVLVTAGLALMTIGAVREWGVSLLAAGGAASVIVGLSLQPLLTNLVAGVQIAMTQPFRIEDAVIVENEFGWIEEINATYVVVRLWDWRRLIVPLTYFIQQPFQNWTRETSSLIGSAMFYVGYGAPVGEMRAKLEDICKASPLWDGRVVNLAVTDTKEKSMEVRCLASARSASVAFDLRCEIREKMVAWLSDKHPDTLLYDRNLTEWVAQKEGRPTSAVALAEAFMERGAQGSNGSPH